MRDGPALSKSRSRGRAPHHRRFERNWPCYRRWLAERECAIGRNTQPVAGVPSYATALRIHSLVRVKMPAGRLHLLIRHSCFLGAVIFTRSGECHSWERAYLLLGGVVDFSKATTARTTATSSKKENYMIKSSRSSTVSRRDALFI